MALLANGEFTERMSIIRVSYYDFGTQCGLLVTVSVLWYFGPGPIVTLHLSSSYCTYTKSRSCQGHYKIGRVLYTRVLNYEFSTSTVLQSKRLDFAFFEMQHM